MTTSYFVPWYLPYIAYELSYTVVCLLTESFVSFVCFRGEAV